MWGNEVECPYCGKNVDVQDSLSELDSNNNTDWECPHCEEEFEITVEFEPSFSTDKIVYVECQNCGDVTRYIRKYRSVYPFPKIYEGKDICESCWRSGLSGEYKANKEGEQA